MSCAGGQCCAVFPLGGLSYDELERRYHRIRDGATIFDMARPLTRDQARERLAALGFEGKSWSDDEPLFRCVRWDEQTKLCTRYDERPEMCRDYPYDGTCEHGDCGHREPELTRWRWLVYRASPKPERHWSFDGREWTPNPTALTFPG